MDDQGKNELLRFRQKCCSLIESMFIDRKLRKNTMNKPIKVERIQSAVKRPHPPP